MTSIEYKNLKNLVLTYSEPTFPDGALLTPKAYTEFLSIAKRAEVQTHSSALIDLELAHLLDKPVVTHNKLTSYIFRHH